MLAVLTTFSCDTTFIHVTSLLFIIIIFRQIQGFWMITHSFLLLCIETLQLCCLYCYRIRIIPETCGGIQSHILRKIIRYHVKRKDKTYVHIFRMEWKIQYECFVFPSILLGLYCTDEIVLRSTLRKFCFWHNIYEYIFMPLPISWESNKGNSTKTRF